MAITLNGTTGITSPGGDVSVSQGLSGNLAFTGTGNRITGDFSNATVANRVMFQTSTVNGATRVHAIPNGSGVVSAIAAINNSDANNASFMQMSVNATEAQMISTLAGTGTYLPMTFYTGGSERVRIDTSGNVGIGTSSPSSFSAKLVVNNGTNKNATVRGGVRLGGSTIQSIQDNAATDSPLEIFTGSAQLQLEGNPITFYNGGERMRIDSSGNLLVGDTTSYGGRINAANGSGIWGMAIRDIAANTQAILFQNSSGTSVGSITVGASTTSYNTSSDYRLKDITGAVTGSEAKDFIMALQPKQGTWKVDGSKFVGFLAHEFQEVSPSSVTGKKDAVDKDGKPIYQGMQAASSEVMANLIALVQELTARLEVLENK